MRIAPFPEVENIHPVAIPFPINRHLISANVYALGSKSLTLIDTGPKLPGILSMLKESLITQSVHLSKVDRIIITHGHIDHYGLAVSIQKAIGHPVECFIHPEDKWRISSINQQEEVWSHEIENFMTTAGVPPNRIKPVKARFSFFKSMCDPVNHASIMNDGDEFTGEGYRLKVIYTPGHSPGSCCLYEPDKKVLFSGDHILKHITPNPIVELKRTYLSDPNYQSLKAFMNSLDKLYGLDVRFVFSGHGEYIDDLPLRIAAYKSHHRRRMELILKALKRKSQKLCELMDIIFPELADEELFLAASDILAHLEILINNNQAELADPGPPASFHAT